MPWFRRNYKPVYPMTNEELMEKVLDKLNKSAYGIYIMRNDQAYNMYGDGDWAREVKTEHLVMWYDRFHGDISSNYILNQITMYAELWYHIFENNSEKKSIQLPHFHLIKIID